MSQPKHLKMYANSPTLATDDNGNKYIKKNDTPYQEPAPAVDTSAFDSARTEMFIRHQQEFMDLYKTHLPQGNKQGD